MRTKVLLALLIATAAPGPAVFAQQSPDPGGIRSETQRRLSQADPTNKILNWLGLLGLIGLVGLRRGHDEDSYHPPAID